MVRAPVLASIEYAKIPEAVVDGATIANALTPLFADPLSPFDTWAVFDPASQFVWELTSSPSSCFHCDRGVETFQVDPTTGKMTDVPTSFFFITNSEVGDVQSLAITH
jgi:hypothetical protein